MSAKRMYVAQSCGVGWPVSRTFSAISPKANLCHLERSSHDVLIISFSDSGRFRALTALPTRLLSDFGPPMLGVHDVERDVEVPVLFANIIHRRNSGKAGFVLEPLVGFNDALDV